MIRIDLLVGKTYHWLKNPDAALTEHCCHTQRVSPKANDKPKNISVSPNPFINSIILSGYNYNEEISFKIYDINSKLVLEGKTFMDTPIKITGIMNGIYFIKIKLWI